MRESRIIDLGCSETIETTSTSNSSLSNVTRNRDIKIRYVGIKYETFHMCVLLLIEILLKY